MDAKRINTKKILAIVTSLVCIFTLLQPWLHIGIRSSSGRMMDINSVFEILDGDGLEDTVEYFLDDFKSAAQDYLNADVSRELKNGQKAVIKIGKALRDSKLSPAETAAVFTSIADVACAMECIGDVSDMGRLESTCTIIGLILWLLIFTIAAFSLYNVYAELFRKKKHDRFCTVLYAVLVLLYIAVTVLVNSYIKSETGDSFLLELAGISDPSPLHMQLFPYVGLLFLVANLWLGKRLPEKTVEVALPSRAEIYAAGVKAKNKLIWTCDCGAINQNSAAYCPKCGGRRPTTAEDSAKKPSSEKIVTPAKKRIPEKAVDHPVPSARKKEVSSEVSRVKKQLKPMDDLEDDFASIPSALDITESRVKTHKPPKDNVGE